MDRHRSHGKSRFRIMMISFLPDGGRRGGIEGHGTESRRGGLEGLDFIFPWLPWIVP